MLARIILTSFLCICLVTCQEFENSDMLFEDCNQTITENAGFIVSTNFSSSYPSNHRCWWTIVAEEGSIVQLLFWYFNVERGTYCQNDKLSVYDGPSSKSHLLGRFCGPFRPAGQVSTSNKMHLEFVTDASNQRKGFYASFSAEREVSAAEGSCGGLLSSPTGSFQSPNYGISNYPPSVSCSWHIRVPGSASIRLSFKEFDLEKSHGCKFDALVVNGGASNANEDSVKRYCGRHDSLPEEIISEGEELFVSFITDASGFGRGFVAHYETDRSARRTGVTGGPNGSGESASLASRPNPTPTTTVATTTGSTVCPRRCTKVKPKTRACTANYMAAIRIGRTNDIVESNRVTVNVFETLKFAETERPTTIQLQLVCPNCHKVRRPGIYLVLGNLENGFLALHPNDYIGKYKSKKHPKVIPKWIRNCSRRRGRRKRRGHNKRRRSS